MIKKIFTLLVMVSISAGAVFSQNTFTDLIKSGQTKLDAKNFAGASQDFSSALKSKEGEINSYVKKRQEYDKLSDFEKASLDNAELFAPRNDYAQPFYYRGLANIGLGQKDQAYKDFDMAAYIDPKYAGALYERGKLKVANGDKDGGCVDIRTAADLGSLAAKEAYDDNFCWSNSLNYVKEGQTKYNLRQYDAAITDFDYAIKLNPDSASNFLYRGLCYYGLGRFDLAMKDFSKMIELNPNSKEAYYNRGLCYYSTEKHKQAFDDFTTAIGMDPNYADAFMYRAAACEAMGNFKSAIYDYGQIIRIKPDDGLGYYKRGLAKQEMKDKTACSDFKKAAALGNEEAADYANNCK